MLTGVASLTLCATVLNSAAPACLAPECPVQSPARPEVCGIALMKAVKMFIDLKAEMWAGCFSLID